MKKQEDRGASSWRAKCWRISKKKKKKTRTDRRFDVTCLLLW